MGCTTWGAYGLGLGVGPGLLLLILVIVAATMLMGGTSESVREVLDRRYARGEISKEQYQDMCASIGAPR